MYAGLRPLLSGESESTSKLSREHVVGHPVPGLVVVAGGKYTTYRVMAEDAVNEAVRGLDPRVPDSCTDRSRSSARRATSALWNQRNSLAAARTACCPHRTPARRYGSLIDELLDDGPADPTLRDPLPGADDYLRVEALYAVTHEGARHLEDVLARRTRISIESWDRGVERAETVAGYGRPARLGRSPAAARG